MLRNLTTASPLKVARALTRRGFRVVALTDGDDIHDGDLRIGPMVHVQVPSFGGAPRVVVEPLRSDARCYPPRTSVAELAQDIRDALDDAPSAALGGCSIH